MEPILEVVGHRLWEFAPLPFRPFSHGGGGSGERGDGIQGSGMLGAIREGAGLAVLGESPGVELLLGFGGRMAIGLWVGVRTGEMGRGCGPGVGGREIAIGGLRALGRGREGRGEVEGVGEGGAGGGGV